MTGLKTKIRSPLIQESVEFYTKYLGMKVLESWDDPGDRGVILGFGSPDGEAFLEIYDTEPAPTYEGFGLQFRVTDLADVMDRLRGHVDFRGPVERPWGSTYLFFEDPSGVEVVVYQGGL